MNVALVVAAWLAFYLIAIHQPGAYRRWRQRLARNRQAAAYRRRRQLERAGGRL